MSEPLESYCFNSLFNKVECRVEVSRELIEDALGSADLTHEVAEEWVTTETPMLIYIAHKRFMADEADLPTIRLTAQDWQDRQST